MTMNVVMAGAGDLGECVDGAACLQDFNCEAVSAVRPVSAGRRVALRPMRRRAPMRLDPVSGLPNPCVEQDDGRVCALESRRANARRD